MLASWYKSVNFWQFTGRLETPVSSILELLNRSWGSKMLGALRFSEFRVEGLEFGVYRGTSLIRNRPP
jgi:hypothetical protein